MTIRRITDKPVGKPYVCYELCLRDDRDCRQLVLLASIPGRESQGIYRWTLVSGLPDHEQVEDLVATVASLVRTATVLKLGVQETLPLG